jgi:hypothetical protein
MQTSHDTIEQMLSGYGAPDASVVRLDNASTAEQIRYLDLVRLPTDAGVKPTAVVEFRQQPVLYAVEDQVTINPLSLIQLRRRLAFRGDAEYLAVLEPGKLRLYKIGFSSALADPEVIQRDDPNAIFKIPEIALKPPIIKESNATTIHRLLCSLLNQTIESLQDCGVEPPDALSLAGRALFFRFLIDRKMIDERDRPAICSTAQRLEECFTNPGNTALTCQWLDTTFNGDLLPLSDGKYASFLRTLGQRRSAQIFSSLTNIILKIDPRYPGQLRFPKDWCDCDFGHIPIGLLSQVYEHHSHRYDPLSRAASIHYTPRFIAEYMVEEAFSDLDSPHAARILDPAVGAGVFLVAAYRHLAAARWKHDRRRPSTKVLRDILYNQLVGFDINESALRLTALSLYLTALELDPDPKPISKLKFYRNLQGTVLFDMRSEEERRELKRPFPVAGSLGRRVPDLHNSRYDIVLGNPPWTAWNIKLSVADDAGEDGGAAKAQAKADLAKQIADVSEIIRSIVKNRLGSDAAREYVMVDRVPDLPFFWRALQWARPGGRIAFAMHARLIFKQFQAGQIAQRALFDAVRVTGILNGAAIRNTEVWPKVSAPFCLVFAENERPTQDSAFYFVSPELEASLNRYGRVRVDAKAAQPVSISMLRKRPTLLKTLFRGTSLDAAVIEKINDSTKGVPLKAYWESMKLNSGDGYQLGTNGTIPDPKYEWQKLGELTAWENLGTGCTIAHEQLPRFNKKRVYRLHSRDIYRGPLVLVSESPSTQRDKCRVVLSWEDIVFSESFIGYSCHGHPQAKMLARYLLIVLNSDFVLYHTLMTSSKFGVEREALLKEDIEQLPIIPFEKLPIDYHCDINRISDALLTSGIEALPAVNRWVAKIYALDRWDLETIEDTLSVSLPFSDNKRRAQLRPTNTEVSAFARRVESEIAPFLTQFGSNVTSRVQVDSLESPWIFVKLSGTSLGRASAPVSADRHIPEFIKEADECGSSQIFVHEGNSVLIGILGQYRYWTPTRARLCALDILHDQQSALLATEEKM